VQSAYGAASSEHENELDVSAVSVGGADVIVVSGVVVSIRNGPRCETSLQPPEERSVRRWNHQEPSERAEERLVVAASTSFAVSGTVVAASDHS
jgi:hypothetical protein